MPNVPPFAVRTQVEGSRSWVALGLSVAVHAVAIAFAVLRPVPNGTPEPAPVATAERVAIAPVEMPALQEPVPVPPKRQVQPPQDAVPLGPDSDRPDAAVPREAGPVEPEPEINPPAAPDQATPEPSAPAAEPEPVSRRIPTALDYSMFAMSRLRPATSPFGSPAPNPSEFAPAARPVNRGSSVGAMGQVGMSNTPDSKDWRPSFPEAAGRCVDIPDLGTNPDGSPVLATVLGRVYEADGRTPLIGAHLQIVGTRFATFSGQSGDYRLQFDPKLLERCRVQYVRVAAEGYDGRMLTLSIGRNIRSDDVLLRRR